MLYKIIFPVFLLFSAIIFGQTQKKDPTKKLMDDAEIAVSKFVGELTNTTIFKKYYELDTKESTIVGNFSIQELRSGILDDESIIGYVLTYRLKPMYYPIKETNDLKFDIHLNRNFKVDYSEVWNSNFSPAVEGNLQVKYDQLPEDYHKKFIMSQLSFADKLEHKKVLKKEQILAFLKQNFSDKKFNDIELTRTSWPPYDVHFEVTQTECSSCLQLEFPVDTLEISEQSTVEVRAL